jgi:hypothetical protein
MCYTFDCYMFSDPDPVFIDLVEYLLEGHVILSRDLRRISIIYSVIRAFGSA